MIKNSQLQEFLKVYANDAEVIIIDNGTHEIKHVGMAYDIVTKKYKVVLASEKPTHYCKMCGENVHKTNGILPSGNWFCPTCNKDKCITEVSKF